MEIVYIHFSINRAGITTAICYGFYSFCCSLDDKVGKMEKYTWQFISKASEPMMHRIVWDTPEDVPPGSVCGPERRNLYLIECNVYGYGSFILNGKRFEIGPRKCYIIHPGDELTLIADEREPRIALWCFFGGARVGEILRSAGIDSSNPFAPDELFDELYGILKRLHTVRTENDMGAELIKTAYLYEFLGTLTRGRVDIERNIIAERAISIMETEYARDMSVSDIASELGFDRSYFSTLFKECTGTSPHTYLTGLRVRKACVLLSEKDMSVLEVAESVGINPHNFSRFFKRETGISPTKYKKQIVDKKEAARADAAAKG